MNLKTVLLLISAALIASGVGLMVHQRREAARSANPAPAGAFLPKFDLNAVAEVQIRDNSSSATVRKSPEGWVVVERGNYPADFGAVGDLVQRLWDFKPAQEVIAGPSQFGRLQLLPPDGKSPESGTLVEFKAADGSRLAAAIFGKESFAQPDPDSPFPPQPNGRFVVAADSQGPVAVAASGFEDLPASPSKWLDPAFVSLHGLQELAVEGAGFSWSARRNGAGSPWVFVNAPAGEVPDQAKLDAAASMLSNLRFQDVVTEPKDALFSAPARLTSTTAEGLQVVWTVGERQAGEYPVKVSATSQRPPTRSPAEGESEEDKKRLDAEFEKSRAVLEADLARLGKLARSVYLVPANAVESLLKPRAEFLPAPPAASPPAP